MPDEAIGEACKGDIYKALGKSNTRHGRRGVQDSEMRVDPKDMAARRTFRSGYEFRYGQ